MPQERKDEHPTLDETKKRHLCEWWIYKMLQFEKEKILYFCVTFRSLMSVSIFVFVIFYSFICDSF